jgi:hypothetical protein
MPHYRIYDLNEFDRILTGRDAYCDDDEAALAAAADRLGTARGVEIWQATRCVGRLHREHQARAADARVARGEFQPAAMAAGQ